MLNKASAVKITRDWNTKDQASGYVGYVTRFYVKKQFLKPYTVQTVGSYQHQKDWLPAEELKQFNQNIVGKIAVITEFRPEKLL